MPGIRRATGGAVAGLGVIVALAVPALPAYAAPYTGGATITSNTSNPDQGGGLTIHVAGMAPGEKVDDSIHSVFTLLNTVLADINGAFTTTVTLPDGLTGNHVVTATGESSGRTA